MLYGLYRVDCGKLVPYTALDLFGLGDCDTPYVGERGEIEGLFDAVVCDGLDSEAMPIVILYEVDEVGVTEGGNSLYVPRRVYGYLTETS